MNSMFDLIYFAAFQSPSFGTLIKLKVIRKIFSKLFPFQYKPHQLSPSSLISFPNNWVISLSIAITVVESFSACN